MKTPFILGAIAAVALGIGGMTSLAQGGTSPSGRQAAATECSACHMAYSPQFLPKESWQAIMGNLSDHFGEDASLDPKLTKKIEAYLTLNAAKWRKVSNPPPLRITELRWFTREHGRWARNKAKSNPDIGSLSNCQGCHRGAGSGSFDDD